MAIIYTETRLFAERRDKQTSNGNSYTGSGSVSSAGGGTTLSGGQAGQVAIWDSSNSIYGYTGFTLTGSTLFFDGDLNVTGEVTAFWNSYTGGTSGTSGVAGSSGTSGTSGTSGGSGSSGSGGTSGTSGTSVQVSGATGQVLVMTSTTTIGGSTGVTFSGGTLYVTGNIVASGEVSAYGSGFTNNLWSDVIRNTPDTWTGTTKTSYIVTLTAAEYAALGSKDSGTLYFVI